MNDTENFVYALRVIWVHFSYVFNFGFNFRCTRNCCFNNNNTLSLYSGKDFGSNYFTNVSIDWKWGEIFVSCLQQDRS